MTTDPEGELPTTRDEAIDVLLEYADDVPRGIVDERFVRGVCEALEIPVPEDEMRRIGDMRANVDPNNDMVGMGVAMLTAHVVDHLGGDATRDAPFIGAGLTAEKVSESNAAKLRELTGREPSEE